MWASAWLPEAGCLAEFLSRHRLRALPSLSPASLFLGHRCLTILSSESGRARGLSSALMGWIVLPHPTFICWSPDPQYLRMGLYLDMRSLKGWLSYKWVISSGLIPTITRVLRRDQDTNLHREKTLWKHGRRWPSNKPRREASEETKPADALIWDFNPPELWENQLLLF